MSSKKPKEQVNNKPTQNNELENNQQDLDIEKNEQDATTETVVDNALQGIENNDDLQVNDEKESDLVTRNGTDETDKVELVAEEDAPEIDNKEEKVDGEVDGEVEEEDIENEPNETSTEKEVDAISEVSTEEVDVISEASTEEVDAISEVSTEKVDEEKETASKKGKKDKKEKPAEKGKFKKFISKYKLPLIIILAVIVVAAAITTTVLVVNAPKVFVRSAEDFSQDTTKKKIYILKKNITVDTDLIIKDGLNINLNKKTLTVNGEFKISLGNDKTTDINIGTLKKKEYISGGKIVAESIDFTAVNATINIYSPLYIKKGDIAVKGLELQEKVEIADSELAITSANIKVYNEILGKVQLSTSNLELLSGGKIDQIIADEFSNIVVYGDIIDSIVGGNEVSVLGNANCPQVKHSKILYYQYQTANIDAYEVDTVYDVHQLESPTQLNIEKKGNSFYCVASEVLYADLYVFTIKDGDTVIKELSSSSNKVDITEYIKNPKTYNISVQASSSNTRINIPSNLKEIEYKYAVKLESPSLAITKTNEDKIVLSFPAIDFATVYQVDINGKKEEKTATSSEIMSIDLTNDIAEIGSYYIKVVATNPSNSAFTDSDSVMISYIKTIKLDTPNVSLEDKGETITLSWDTIENADSYLIVYGKDGSDKRIMTRKDSYTFSKLNIEDNTIFEVYAQGKDYYVTSESVSKSFEYPQLAVPIIIPLGNIEEGFLQINTSKVQNAQTYILIVNGEEREESDTEHFSVANIQVGDKLQIKVVAKYYRSAFSEEIVVLS